MHTTNWHGVRRNPITLKDEDVVIYMHHNGDYSGDVIIDILPKNHKVDDLAEEILVPFKALAELVGQAVLSKQIESFEQKTGIEVLDL